VVGFFRINDATSLRVRIVSGFLPVIQKITGSLRGKIEL
jgi:hypothetical protein